MMLPKRLKAELFLIHKKRGTYFRDAIEYRCWQIRRLLKDPMTRTRKTGTVTIAFTSAGRLDVLRPTIESLQSMLQYPAEHVKWAIIDDAPEATLTHEYIRSLNLFSTIIINKKNYGLGHSLNCLYATIDTEYVLHCEDDWDFLRPIDLSAMIAAYEKDTTLSQMVLYREPIKEGREYPNARIAADNRYAVFDSVFALNPHLIAMDIHAQHFPFPQNGPSENYTYKIARSKRKRIGIWGYGSEPFVRHTGDFRVVNRRY